MNVSRSAAANEQASESPAGGDDSGVRTLCGKGERGNEYYRTHISSKFMSSNRDRGLDVSDVPFSSHVDSIESLWLWSQYSKWLSLE